MNEGNYWQNFHVWVNYSFNWDSTNDCIYRNINIQLQPVFTRVSLSTGRSFSIHFPEQIPQVPSRERQQ